jgi:hypothetical protein
MKINLSDKIIAWLALLSGLTISAVAIWYSVAGLVSIFAAAVVPIIVMGVVLEVSKLIATVWLKINWTRAPIFIRSYLIAAIAILMVITSMGIFGFLSKAHSDAGLVSGDVMAKIAVYDEKIKISKENIDANRKALKQLDEAVDQVMGRSTTETGADKAVQIRRSQAKERSRLQAEIAAEQKAITSLNEARAPIAAEVRKVEAEVGPIKYIANFIYGDNPDANILEKAVTWVIIIIVVVFDPLAVILLLASQYSFQWFRTAREEDDELAVKEWFEQGKDRARQLDQEVAEQDAEIKAEPFIPASSPLWPFPVQGPTPAVEDRELSVFEKHPYLLAPWVSQVPEEFRVGPQVYKTEEPAESEHDDEDELAQASESEKTAMTRWKADHPDSSLKLQRKLLERNVIKELPWESYLKPQPDHVDDAASEAAKWVEEQRVLADESKKKDSDLVGETRDTTDQENQRNVSYVQNAEQTGSTLWQRVKAKKDEQ